ncbi:MAG: ABC transporter ATP-binding protein [Pseudomonadota bacterium]
MVGGKLPLNEAGVKGMIEIEGLTFDYPTKRALFDVSLRIEEGSITALVGPNGAGKTTLMRCIAALSTFDRGRVVVAGRDVRRQPREVHEVLGFLPDFFGLYDDLSVERCLTYAARSRGIGQGVVKDAVAKAAASVGLEDRLGEPAGHLSRGLRQRLGIAQAIVHEPDVVLLDEPASGLDPEARAGLSSLLRALQARGMTLVVSSHILSELEDYSTAMVVIEKGRVISAQTVGAATAKDVRIRVEALSPLGPLAEALAAMEAVSTVDVSDVAVGFTIANDRAAHAAILAELVRRGHEIYAFGIVERRLQDVYFEEIKAQKEPH